MKVEFRTPGPTILLKVLKVLNPTVSRESSWNHSIKKWSDKTSPFILNDSTIFFIAFADVYITKNGYQKQKKIRTSGPPHFILDFSLTYINFVGGFPKSAK